MGELSDARRIGQAVHGADAVLSALGPTLKRGSTGTPVTDGTEYIVAAMEAEQVCRYIGLATPSVPDERDKPTLKSKILPRIAGLLFPSALAEIVAMTKAVTDSGLDRAIARITSPNDGRPKGTVRAGFLGRDKVGSAMSRSDIAAFLVGQLDDDTFSRAAPATLELHHRLVAIQPCERISLEQGISNDIGLAGVTGLPGLRLTAPERLARLPPGLPLAGSGPTRQTECRSRRQLAGSPDARHRRLATRADSPGGRHAQ